METEEATTRTESYDVRGMHCAACASKVEKALGGVPGVEHAGINLAMERATVRVTDEADPDALMGAVERAGYELVPLADRATSHAGHRESSGASGSHDHGIALGREEELTRVAWRRFVIAAVLTVPIVALGMFPGLFGAEMHTRWVGWTMFALTIPVQFWAGRPFLASAIEASAPSGYEHGHARRDRNPGRLRILDGCPVHAR